MSRENERRLKTEGNGKGNRKGYAEGRRVGKCKWPLKKYYFRRRSSRDVNIVTTPPYRWVSGAMSKVGTLLNHLSLLRHEQSGLNHPLHTVPV